jgi:hypothetical protein
MKTYGEWIQIHVFFTLTLVEGEWSVLCPCCFITMGKASCTNRIGDWVGPRTGLDDADRRKILPLPGLELQPLYSQLAIPTLLSQCLMD